MLQDRFNSASFRARIVPENFIAIALAILGVLAGESVYAATSGRVANSIDITDDQIILVELRESYTDSSLFDLEDTTISFVPDGEGGYSVERKALQWNPILGVEMDASNLASDPNVLANRLTLENFYFPFSGEKFREIYVSPSGLITFDSELFSAIVQRMRSGEFRYDNGLKRLSASFFENTIAPLFWVYNHNSIEGAIHANQSSQAATITFSVSEPCCHLDSFTTENNVNEYQVKLYSSGQIDFSYRTIESNMGIVGIFPIKTYGLGQLVASFDFESSSELDPKYDIINVSIYKTEDSQDLEFVYTFAGDITDVVDPESKNWYLSMQVRRGSSTWWSSHIGGGAYTLLVRSYFEAVSEPIIRENQLFVTMNLARARTGDVIEIVNRVNEYADKPGDRINFEFTYPQLIFRETPTRNIDFSTEEIASLHSRIYEGFFHQADVNTDWIMCDAIAVLGDIFTTAAHYSDFRLDYGAASSPVKSFDSPSKGIGIGVGFDAEPRDGPSPVGFCKTYDLQSNLARVIPLGAVAGSSFGSTPYHYSSGLLTHEVGHTWIVRGLPAEVDGENVWLDRFGGHWSIDLHSPVPFSLSGRVESSTMGGVNWRNNGDGTFSRFNTNVLASGFSYLDLYLMGIIPPENVPDFFIVNNYEYAGVGIDGNTLYTVDKVDVTIEDVIAANGPRFPTYLESPKDFNMAFTHVRQYGKPVDQRKLDILRGVRDAFFDNWCKVTGGLSTIYSEITSKYQSPNPCILSTDLGIGTEDPSYGVSYDWPDLSIFDFATVDRGYLQIRDWDLVAGDTFTAWIDIEGNGTVDIYVRFVLPDGTWITLGSGGELSQPSEVLPFLQSHDLESGILQRIELMNITLGTGADYGALQKGDYLLLVDIAHEGQSEPFHRTKNVTARSHRFRVN